jgi:hypothetical protein
MMPSVQSNFKFFAFMIASLYIWIKSISFPQIAICTY